MQCGLYRYKDRAWSQLASLSSHTDQVTCIAINSQDNLFATAAWDGRVCVWSAGDKKEMLSSFLLVITWRMFFSIFQLGKL